MTREDLRAFAQRDWRLLAASKEAFWIERKRRLGPAEGLRAGEELRRWAQATHPDWPNAEERQADLEAHVRLSELLSRVPAR